jgi:hypothetical protein
MTKPVLGGTPSQFKKPKIKAQATATPNNVFNRN